VADLRRKESDPRKSRRLRTDGTDGSRNNLTERRVGRVKRETRYDYAAAVAVRYQDDVITEEEAQRRRVDPPATGT